MVNQDLSPIEGAEVIVSVQDENGNIIDLLMSIKLDLQILMVMFYLNLKTQVLMLSLLKYLITEIIPFVSLLRWVRRNTTRGLLN